MSCVLRWFRGLWFAAIPTKEEGFAIPKPLAFSFQPSKNSGYYLGVIIADFANARVLGFVVLLRPCERLFWTGYHPLSAIAANSLFSVVDIAWEPATLVLC